MWWQRHNKLEKILRDWYKPTKKGERARKLLDNMDGQTGAIGEDVDDETAEKRS